MSESDDFLLNWGLVGSGLIAHDFCTAIKSSGSNLHVLKSVAALTLDEANDFACEFNIPKKYWSFDQIFSDPDVDIIYVATINRTHRDFCLKAINAGKHVLCEKPMCLSLIEQEEILTAAKEKNVFFMEAIWIRFTPAMDAVREELTKHKYGELKCFAANHMNNNIHLDRIRNKEGGGGAIFDLGIYVIQLACEVFKHEKPIKIIASGQLMNTGVDEFETITLIYENNRMASLTVSCNCGREDSAVIVGSKGWLRISNIITSALKLEYSNGEKIEIPPPEAGNLKYNFFNRVCLRYEAEECRLAISKGLRESPKCTHDHSRLIMYIIEESRKQLGYFFENEK